MKNYFSVRLFLGILLFLSVIFASYSIYYKIKYWGFSISPSQNSNVWNIESHISFTADGSPITVTLRIPSKSNLFRTLEENIIAPAYKTKRQSDKIVFKSKNLIGEQNLYYQTVIFDNARNQNKLRTESAPSVIRPSLDDKRLSQAQEILSLVNNSSDSDKVSQLITLLNQEPLHPAISSYLPVQQTQKTKINTLIELLALNKTPARIARGIELKEGTKVFPNLLLDVHTNGYWQIYNIETGEKGIPDNFVLLQRGTESLLDITGGIDSTIKFSIQKSITSSMKLASLRAKTTPAANLFTYSIYSLPVAQQNTLKWLSVFPIAILVVVLIRNVIGIQTMGTFTPMLIAMSFVKTGFIVGLSCFVVILALGLIIRFLMSKFNLLLVPRISAVVIFVILIIHTMTILGFKFDIKIAQASVFFPIIITAWIIERASITWEEDGPANAGKELFNGLLTGILVYFVIENEFIRHLMFVFNELNLVILVIVMLLGTYTGYRLTELKRFSPIVKK